MAGDEKHVFMVAFEQLPDGVIITDCDDRIIFVNKAMEDIRNVQGEKILGTSIRSCHSEKSFERVERALKYLRRDDTRSFTRMITDTNKGRFYETTYAPIREGQDYFGSLIISRDVTEKRNLEEEKTSHMQNLKEKVTELTERMQDLFVSSMSSLVHALEERDSYTKGHSMRVRDIAEKMVEYKYGICLLSRVLPLINSYPLLDNKKRPLFHPYYYNQLKSSLCNSFGLRFFINMSGGH